MTIQFLAGHVKINSSLKIDVEGGETNIGRYSIEINDTPYQTMCVAKKKINGSNYFNVYTCNLEYW